MLRPDSVIIDNGTGLEVKGVVAVTSLLCLSFFSPTFALSVFPTRVSSLPMWTQQQCFSRIHEICVVLTPQSMNARMSLPVDDEDVEIH